MPIVIQAPKLAWDISTDFNYSVRLVNRKSKMAAIFQDGHEQMHLTSSSSTYLTEFVNFGVKVNVSKMLKSTLNVP